MTYEVNEGLSEAELKPWLTRALSRYGLYLNQGINYTNADIAPIVMCTVSTKDQILIVKRAHNLADANGYWSTVNGFIDEIKDVKEIAQNEILEELGLKIRLQDIKVARSYTLKNSEEKRQHIVFPCLIQLNTKPKITLNEENTEFKWIDPAQIDSYHILSDLPYSIERALELKA